MSLRIRKNNDPNNPWFLGHVPENRELFDAMNLVLQEHCRQIMSKRDQMILDRLEEMGYDISDKVAIAKRCEVRMIEGDKVREIFIDSGTPDKQLVCYFTEISIMNTTEPPFKITTEFKFAPMPE